MTPDQVYPSVMHWKSYVSLRVKWPNSEDILSKACLVILKKIDAGIEIEHPRRFAFAVVFKCIQTYYNNKSKDSKYRQKIVLLDIDDLDLLAMYYTTPEAQCEYQEKWSTMQNALTQLKAQDPYGYSV